MHKTSVLSLLIPFFLGACGKTSLSADVQGNPNVNRGLVLTPILFPPYSPLPSPYTAPVPMAAPITVATPPILAPSPGFGDLASANPSNLPPNTIGD